MIETNRTTHPPGAYILLGGGGHTISNIIKIHRPDGGLRNGKVRVRTEGVTARSAMFPQLPECTRIPSAVSAARRLHQWLEHLGGWSSLSRESGFYSWCQPWVVMIRSQLVRAELLRPVLGRWSQLKGAGAGIFSRWLPLDTNPSSRRAVWKHRPQAYNVHRVYSVPKSFWSP